MVLYAFGCFLFVLSILRGYYEWCVLPTNHRNTVGRILGKVGAREDVSYQYIIDTGDTLISNHTYYRQRIIPGNHLVIQYTPASPYVNKFVPTYGLDLNAIPFGTELSDSMLLEYK